MAKISGTELRSVELSASGFEDMVGHYKALTEKATQRRLKRLLKAMSSLRSLGFDAGFDPEGNLPVVYPTSDRAKAVEALIRKYYPTKADRQREKEQQKLLKQERKLAEEAAEKAKKKAKKAKKVPQPEVLAPALA